MRQHAQVSTSSHLDCAIGHWRVINVATGDIPRARCLTNSIGQCLKIIRCRLERIWIGGDAHDLPAARRSQALTVHLAQVVAVWLCVGGQRSKDGSGICVDIRQGRGRRGLT